MKETIRGLTYSVSEMFIFSAFSVKIRIPSVLTVSDPVTYLDRVFLIPLTVMFSGEDTNITVSEWCLGQYSDGSWSCVSEIQLSSNGEYVSTVPSTGRYAVMYRIPVEVKSEISAYQRSQVKMR